MVMYCCVAKKKKQQKTVALDTSLHIELKVLATRRQIELTELLNQIVKEYLAKSTPDSLGGGIRREQ